MQDFTRQEAVFAFCFSKMFVIDELRQHLQSVTLTLTDFLEALARVRRPLARTLAPHVRT